MRRKLSCILAALVAATAAQFGPDLHAHDPNQLNGGQSHASSTAFTLREYFGEEDEDARDRAIDALGRQLGNTHENSDRIVIGGIDQRYFEEGKWSEFEQLSKKPSSIAFLGSVVSKHATMKPRTVLVLSLANLGEKDLQVMLSSPVCNCVTVLVRSSSGEPVRWTEIGAYPFGSGFVEHNYMEVKTIKPARAVAVTLPLDEYFNLAKPGEYEVLASIVTGESNGDFETVATPVVKFRVAAPK